MILVSLGLSGVALLLLLLCSLLLFEVLTACLPVHTALERDRPQTCSTTNRLTIIIPAHNEESGLPHVLASLQPQLSASTEVVVIADNCTDATAAVARSAGASVLERNDPQRRGKGYALDYGLQTLSVHPPDVVIVLDADCLVLPGAIAQLSSQALNSGQPAQAVYLMEQPSEPNPKDQVSAFAFKVKNQVRLLGLTRLGWPCPLTGTGMAFPWAVIAAVDMASGHIVEDMKLGIDLAIASHPPRLCPAAQVQGQLPTADSARSSQRTRWEHGHLQVLQQYVPRLLSEALSQRRWKLALMALDLAIPPLSLLVLLWLGVIAIAVAWGYFSAVWVPTGILSAAGIALLSAILMAWVRFGRESLSLQQLLRFPLYILWKIPLYAQFLLKPQSQWIRTRRDPSE